MELAIAKISKPATKAGSVTVADDIYGYKYNEDLVHQLVVAHLAGSRSGTKAQKTRSECRGGGKKPFKQKGTGRARAGSIRSPLWIGGGRAFAAKPRDHSVKVNKKMYRRGMASILSELVRQDRLTVVDDKDLELKEAKTKKALKLLAPIKEKIKTTENASWRILLLTTQVELNLLLATRNLADVMVLTVDGVDPVSLVGSEQVVISKSAALQLQQRLEVKASE